MPKRKKKTLAYKKGYSAGLFDRHHNPFLKGSTRYEDYERGFVDGKAIGQRSKRDARS